MEAPSAPLEIYRTRVAAEWIDYNGHMNEGYYGVAFGDASDAYLMYAGFDDAYRNRVGGTFYTVETHIRFLRELEAGDELLFRTTVLGADARKLQLHHSMVHAAAGYEAATQEVFLLHVTLADATVSPMTPELLATMNSHRDAHAALHPEGVGAAIRSLRERR